MTTAPVPQNGASFLRRRAVRVASGIASAGLLAGFSLIAATPANAATDADCTGANTATANTLGNNQADIQTLLDAHTLIVCIAGTFNITAPLIADYSSHGHDVIVHGLPGAVLDGGGTTRILDDNVSSDFLTVENLTFSHGSVGSSSLGGAIRGNIVETHNSDFNNNGANGGGAISGSVVNVYDTSFEDNVTGVSGGAIFAASSVTAERSTFHHNSAPSVGGAITTYGVATVDSSTFDENTAGLGGGAVFAYSVLISNSTFVGNSATTASAVGGAIAVNSGGGQVIQSTFWDNTANAGAALYNDPGELDIRGNIFSDDVSATPQLAKGATGSLVDLGGNLFTTSAALEAALTSPDVSSKFGLTISSIFGPTPALANNGGGTKTVALSPTSVAINAVPLGSPSVTVDQRGVTRVSLSDAGAYEQTTPAPAPALAATGAAPSTWIGGVAALLLAVGVAVFGVGRRKARA